MTEERHPVRQNDLTDVLVACLSDMFDSQSAHCEASAGAGQECVSGGMLLTRQGMLRAAAAEICLRPPLIMRTQVRTYIRMHPVVVAAAASIIGVPAIAAAIDSLSAE